MALTSGGMIRDASLVFHMQELLISEIFSLDGPLAAMSPGFRVRATQIELAQAVERTIAERSTLIAEAGTGTGKTWAYLVPALLGGGKVLVSTGTRTLQDQLFSRDLPRVREALSIPATIALLKGRGNYVCHYHLERQQGEDRALKSRGEVHQLRNIQTFAQQSATGDRADLPTVPEDAEIWQRVTSTRENCLGQDCPNVRDCFVLKARRQAQEADVVVINHALFMADLMLRDEGVTDLLPAADTVVFDEAHHLRNSNTIRYKACIKIKAQIRWLVTGTPIQNKKRDFKNLCCIAGIKPSIYTNPKEINNFVLRRTKLQVGINLPPVNKRECLIEWQNPLEMKLAEEIHSLLPNQTFVSISKQRKLAKAFGKAGILVALLRARQSCILPNLMRKNMEKLCMSGCIRTKSLDALKYTSKLDAVIKLMLERKDNGKGKIVFCHYQNEIDVIAQRLLKGGMSKVVCYDGRNSGGHNLARLSEPADALIIQIQTGCEGLNLQLNFSEIYFVSPHWNPCVEDQAIARCHRIGQTKEVDVFKFEMRGFINDPTSQSITLEKYVNQVQNIKRDISKQILDLEPPVI